MSLPVLPEVPDDQRGEAEARLRYEDRRDEIIERMRTRTERRFDATEAFLVLQFDADEAIRAEAESARDAVRANRAQLMGWRS